MAFQTAYDLVPAAAFPGMLADLTDTVIESLIADESDITFGVAVAAGDTDTTCELPDNTADLIRGVAVHVHNMAGKYTQRDLVNILRCGKIWVLVDATVVKGGDVFVKHNASFGTFLAADDAGNSSKLVGAVWGSSRTGAGLAILELDLVGKSGAMT